MSQWPARVQLCIAVLFDFAAMVVLIRLKSPLDRLRSDVRCSRWYVNLGVLIARLRVTPRSAYGLGVELGCH